MPDGGHYTALQTRSEGDAPECFAIPESAPKTSSKNGWGGARPNSGGPRPNSGGARPGAGRPRKVPEPLYATDDLLWRVFATHPQAEISATRELTRQGYETYLPMMADRRRDRATPTMWHEVRVPMLTGYGFVRLTNAQSREPITATRGVRELLHRPDGRLWWVPDARMEKFREFAEQKLKLPREHGPVLDVGTLVRVTEGPFADHRGPVLECDGTLTLVELEMFGRPMSIRLGRVAVVEA